jgi:hypothetical protein
VFVSLNVMKLLYDICIHFQGNTTFTIKTFSQTTLSIKILCIKTLSIMAFSRTTLSLKTLSIMDISTTNSLKDTQHNNIQHNVTYY